MNWKPMGTYSRIASEASEELGRDQKLNIHTTVVACGTGRKE
jgi:hypothetical protein